MSIRLITAYRGTNRFRTRTCGNANEAGRPSSCMTILFLVSHLLNSPQDCRFFSVCQEHGTVLSLNLFGIFHFSLLPHPTFISKLTVSTLGMASALNGATASNSLSQAPGSRTTARQTRTNPSRVSKTAARSFPYYGSQNGHSLASDGAGQSAANNVPHGLFPALTHFTDAITALPREFRRHNSLLKEVDAKAWALEDNLYQLLLSASDSRPVPFPQNPAPIVDGEVREYAHTLVRLYLSIYLSTNSYSSSELTGFVRVMPRMSSRKKANSVGCCLIGSDAPCPTSC